MVHLIPKCTKIYPVSYPPIVFGVRKDKPRPANNLTLCPKTVSSNSSEISGLSRSLQNLPISRSTKCTEWRKRSLEPLLGDMPAVSMFCAVPEPSQHPAHHLDRQVYEVPQIVMERKRICQSHLEPALLRSHIHNHLVAHPPPIMLLIL